MFSVKDIEVVEDEEDEKSKKNARKSVSVAVNIYMYNSLAVFFYKILSFFVFSRPH